MVIFHPPVQAEYYDYLASDPRMQSKFGKFRAFVHDLARDYRVVYGETLEDWGLDRSAVVDYGHFSRAGTLRFARQLCVSLQTPSQLASGPTKGRLGASDTISSGPP